VESAGLAVVEQKRTEFPLDEFGHGLLLKAALMPVFLLQKIVGRQSLQTLTAVKRP
jgi:hypothetical protein